MASSSGENAVVTLLFDRGVDIKATDKVRLYDNIHIYYIISMQ